MHMIFFLNLLDNILQWGRCSSFLQIILGYFSKDAPGEVNVIPGKKKVLHPSRCSVLPTSLPTSRNPKRFEPHMLLDLLKLD